VSDGKPRSAVLFLCVANSARSQLAEGWARALAPPDTKGRLERSKDDQPSDENAEGRELHAGRGRHS